MVRRLSLPKFIIVSILLIGCAKETYYKHSQFLMGTTVEIVCKNQKAIDFAFAEVKRIEGLMNKFDRNSEISQLNKLGRLKVSPETLYVIKKAKEFYIVTGGAFDITVAPLADLWKEAIKANYPAKEKDIQQALRYIGSEKIIIDEKNYIIKFSQEGVSVDLGAIAKGFAVDCAIKKLKELGIDSALVDAGGDIRCLGTKNGLPWRIGIQDPRNPNRIIEYLELKDTAVATSGDYEQYFLSGNRHYTHIINPKTGFPVHNGIESVTVIASDCLTADALATGIFVLGKQKGQELIKNFKAVKAIIYTKQDLSE